MSAAEAVDSGALWQPGHGGGGLLPAPVTVRRTGPAEPFPGRETVRAESWVAHRRRWGDRPGGGLWLLDAAANARLSGCGGGFFPAARKWRAALTGRRVVTVVANAAESEPLSAKDATLLRLRPHLVLDGLTALSETLGATSAVLWMHPDTGAQLTLERAVQDRQRAGLDELPVSIRGVAGGYLAGESSAIKQALAGGPLLPRYQGPGSAPHGDEPTVLVHNVETLARLAILSRDAAPARSRSPVVRAPRRVGTRLLTVLTPLDRRVVEAHGTERLGDVVTRVVGREPANDAATLLAGFGGTWVRWVEVAGVRVDEDHLRARGLSLGAGIVAPLWTQTCGLSVTASIVAHLTRASARQCGPCLFGLPALAEAMTRLRDGTARRATLGQLRGDLEAVEGRGACHHPDGAVRLVRSALETFAEDVADHLRGSPCGLPASTIPVPED